MQQSQSHNSGVWDVRRKIVVPALSVADSPASAIEAVEQLEGVHSVKVDAKKRRLVVTYDASRIDYYSITVTLGGVGFPPQDSWWSNLWARIYQFTDSNARDNANTPAPPCCNKPPR